MGSSTAAVTQMLQNMLSRHRLPAALRHSFEQLRDIGQAQATHAKLDRLLKLVAEFGDKMVVFTQFRATQELIGRRLAEAGHDVVLFHGSLSRMEKEGAIEDFRDRARVLVCTESGSEGRNLQFAHGLCNYDLPWNPMKIEQRIGRLSRIGQKHDVHVFNLVARGTVEQAVLHLLDAKLSMFEMVIGEIDMILGNLDDEKEFPEVIADLWAESSGDDEFAARMEVLGTRLLAAKVDYLRQKSADEKLFGNRFAPDA
jgi:SNF2 family DNA or RNA helicase